MITEMSKRIKQKRTEKGLTMEGLASQLGVGNSAVNKWEKGYVTNIKRSTIEKMAEIFDCNPAWLMGIMDDASPAASSAVALDLSDYSEKEIQFIDIYHGLSEEDKDFLEKMALRMVPEKDYEKQKEIGEDDEPML